MIGESIEHAQHARAHIDKALSEIARGRVSSAAPELADAAERLCRALAELAWVECGKACERESADDA